MSTEKVSSSVFRRKIYRELDSCHWNSDSRYNLSSFSL